MKENRLTAYFSDSQMLRHLVVQVFDQVDLRSATRDEYLHRIVPFLVFVQECGLHSNTFLLFKRSLADQHDIGVSTKNKRLTVARLLLTELHRHEYLLTDITHNVKSFQQTKKHKKEGLSQDEIDRVLTHIRTLPPNNQLIRLKAVLSLLTLQGLRQVEITRLNVADIDVVSKTALILGKGRDDKELVDLHPETVRLLQEYMRIYQRADGPLFGSESNNSLGKRLTTRGLRKIITRLLRSAGVNKNVHGFRHYFTTKLIESYQGDLLEVARYTRHRSLEMLQVYNDGVKRKADLPRYYAVFASINLNIVQ